MAEIQNITKLSTAGPGTLSVDLADATEREAIRADREAIRKAAQEKAAAREALRRDLAKKAAPLEALQSELKTWGPATVAREADEKARLVAFKKETLRLQGEKNAVQAKATAAGKALQQLRQEFVPAELRQAVSAADRSVGAARLREKQAREDLTGQQTALEELRHRVKTVPSSASSADLKASIKAAEAACAAPAARLESAAADIQGALAAQAVAQRAYDLSMAAARAQ